MRILMLTTNSSLMDGINRHILTIAPALNSEENIQIAVCTVHPYGDLNSSLEEKGIKAYSLNTPNGHNLHILKRYYDVIKEFNPDIIHIHVMSIMEKIISSILIKKKKYVLTVHGISDKIQHLTFKQRLEITVNKLFQLNIDAICYISKGVKDALYCNTDNHIKVEVIYNPIKFDLSSNNSHKLHDLLNIQYDSIIIGTSCRIAAVKNPEIFTTVMCKILQKMSLVNVAVIGDGDKTIISKCIKIINAYGDDVKSRFHWLGYRKDAPELVKEFSCFIMTSTSEGLPTSLLECFASKTPTAFLQGNGGLKDITEINQKYGPFSIIGYRNDIDTFVDNICKLMSDSERCQLYTERAYEIGKQYFDVNNVAHKLANLYEDIL